MKKIETKKWKDFLVKDVFIIEKKVKNIKCQQVRILKRKNCLQGLFQELQCRG